MAWVFLYIMLLLGGLFTVGATGDLLSAGRYDLVFGPTSLAQSVYSLGDLVDDQMALQSALAREYGTTNIAEVINLLAERHHAAPALTKPATASSINLSLNENNPLDGVVAGGRVMRSFYTQIFQDLIGGPDTGLH
ncbi:MAG: hypothetical protein P8168_06765 [Deltaproteobacteria bacterium]